MARGRGGLPAELSGALVALVLVAAGGLLACGDAFSTHLPAQKTSAVMVLLPDNARVGETVDVHAVIFTPHAVNYVTRYDLGSGVDLLYFDTGGGLGCAEVDVQGLQAPPPLHLFTLCLTVALRTTAGLGERSVSLEVQSDGTAVVARASFWVLPAYPFD
jgi:hypothetical protein